MAGACAGILANRSPGVMCITSLVSHAGTLPTGHVRAVFTFISAVGHSLARMVGHSNQRRAVRSTNSVGLVSG